MGFKKSKSDKAKRKQRAKELKKDIIETRACAICGAEFDINCYQTRKIYCEDCRKGHYEQYRKEYVETHRDKMREYGRRYRKRRPYKEYVCTICGKTFQTHRGGMPKYCTPCLEESKDVYPFKIYYERRMDAECQENSNRCSKDALKKK